MNPLSAFCIVFMNLFLETGLICLIVFRNRLFRRLHLSTISSLLSWRYTLSQLLDQGIPFSNIISVNDAGAHLLLYAYFFIQTRQ